MWFFSLCRDGACVLQDDLGTATAVLSDPRAEADKHRKSCDCFEVSATSAMVEARPLLSSVRRVFGTLAGGMDDEGSGLEEEVLVHEAVGTFIRTLLRGVCIEVMLDDGSVLCPEASLNYDLTHLVLDVNEVQRAIALRDVESIATPADLEQRNILASIRPHLDQRCCTLIIRGFEFVTFRLDTERHREYFAACLAFLISRGSSRENTPMKPMASLTPAI